MAPLVAGIIGAVGIPAVFAPLATALVNTGLALGLSYVARSLAPTAKAETGIQATLQLGGDQPRRCCFGRVGLDGHFIYGNTSNENNNYMQMVYRLGEGPHEDLEYIWVNGKIRALTLVSENQWKKRYRVSGFVTKTGVPVLYVEFWHGYEDQPYNVDLVDWARPAGRWTATDRLAGVCYVVVQAFYIEEAFDSGIPRFRFGLKGRRLYDWRLDDTNGGAGAHRWNDAHTWTYSENPIVQLYNYQRGLMLGGERVVGMGAPPVDLMLDLYTAGANACDEAVPLAEGGEADRYRSGTIVSDDEEHGAAMARILDACAGSLYERVGAYGPIVGVPQSVVFPTITDGDLVSQYPVRFSRKVGRAELINGVFGTCAAPDDQYQPVSYAARTDAAGEAEDGEVRRLQLDFPQVFVQSQAQRLAQIQLNLARLQATAMITLGFSGITLEPGDWVRWNSARFGDRTFVILSLTQNADQTVTLNLREVSAAAYGWTSGDELPAPAPGEEPDGGGLANGVFGFDLAAVTLTGAAGVKIPAVRVYWTPITDPTVTAVILEYGVVGSPDVLRQRIDVPGNGEYLLTAGLQSETDYEMRATIETQPPRDVVWTDMTLVTTTAQLVPSTPAPASITPEQFSDALNDKVLTRMQAQIASMNATLARLALVVADADAAGELNRQDLTRSLVVKFGAAVATFREEIKAVAGPDSAIVEQLTALQAQIAGVEAGLTIRGVVAASVPDGAIAAYEIQATAQSALSGLRIVAFDDGEGGARGEVWVSADRFVVSTPDGSKPVFLIDSESGEAILNLDVVANGSVLADKLGVAVLSAISADLGEIVAGLIRSEDNRLRIDATNVRITMQSLA